MRTCPLTNQSSRVTQPCLVTDLRIRAPAVVRECLSETISWETSPQATNEKRIDIPPNLPDSTRLKRLPATNFLLRRISLRCGYPLWVWADRSMREISTSSQPPSGSQATRCRRCSSGTALAPGESAARRARPSRLACARSSLRPALIWRIRQLPVPQKCLKSGLESDLAPHVHGAPLATVEVLGEEKVWACQSKNRGGRPNKRSQSDLAS